MVGCCFSCPTIARIASLTMHSCSNVPFSMFSSISMSHVCPSYLPRAVYPNGVFPACLNCSTFLSMRWLSTSALFSIFVQAVPSSLGTSTCMSVLSLREFGLRYPNICRPILRHDRSAIQRFSRVFTSLFTRISFSTGSKIFPSLNLRCLFSTIASDISTSYCPLYYLALATTSFNFCLDKLSCLMHSWMGSGLS
jgi:hypothetical protein